MDRFMNIKEKLLALAKEDKDIKAIDNALQRIRKKLKEVSF